MVSGQSFGYCAWRMAPIRAAWAVAALVSRKPTSNRPLVAWAVVSKPISSGSMTFVRPLHDDLVAAFQDDIRLVRPRLVPRQRGRAARTEVADGRDWFIGGKLGLIEESAARVGTNCDGVPGLGRVLDAVGVVRVGIPMPFVRIGVACRDEEEAGVVVHHAAANLVDYA